MKKITHRAVSVLLIAVLIIAGMTGYVLRYIDHAKDWAMAFSRANAGVSGSVTDRNGEVLAIFDETRSAYSEDKLTREACYHITGDYWGRTGSGILTVYWDDMQSFSLLTGTTHAESVELPLTVDASFCRTAYAALQGQNGKGAVMMMNYRTGEVLCMVSGPSFDPMEAEAEPPEGAFLNRCLASVFTPGSVFKLVTAAAAIETVPNMDTRQFYCENKYTIAGVDITCTGPHYTQNFEQALANSCNIAFAQIAVKVGQESMIEHVRQYGFLDKHTLSGMTGAAGSYPLDFVGDPELAWSGIGQSTDLVNPYAMLRFVAAVANHGVLVEPHLLQREEAGETRLMQADTADRLAAMMNYNVVAHYDPDNNFPGLPLCAKTGTAELGDGTSHAWFVGFLNDEAHPYAFVVLVEHGGGGLRVAGPIANRLLQYATSK